MPRATRIGLGIVVTLVAVAALAVGTLFIPAVRSAVLSRALDAASRAVPGRLEAAHASWRLPVLLRIDDLVWLTSLGGDTLASVSGAVIDLDARPLLRGEIRVRSLLATELRADLPAITEFAGGAPGAGGTAPARPSVTVDSLALPRARVRLAPHVPDVAFELTGRAALARPEGEIGSFRLHATLAENASGGTGTLVANGSIEAARSGEVGLDVSATLTPPRRGSLPSIEAWERFAESWPADDPPSVLLTGRVELAPAFAATMELVTTERAGWPRVEARATLLDGDVRVDPFRFESDGVSLGLTARSPIDGTGPVSFAVSARRDTRTVRLAGLIEDPKGEPLRARLEPILVAVSHERPPVPPLPAGGRATGTIAFHRPGGRVELTELSVSGFGVDLVASGTREGERWEGTAGFDVARPELVPFGVFDDLVRVRGRIEASGTLDARRVSGHVTLSPLPGIAGGYAALRRENETVVLDTFDLALDGARVAGAGELRAGGEIRGVARVDLHDPAALAGFIDAVSADRLDDVRAVARFSGRAREPRVDATAVARGVRAGAWLIPELTARASIGAGRPVIWLETGTERLRASARVRVDATDPLSVVAESVFVAFDDEEIRASRPFQLRVLPGEAGLVVEDLALSGSLGTIAANGRLEAGASNLVLTADLHAPALLPGRVTARVVTDARGAEAEVDVFGLALGRRGDLSLSVDLDAHGDSLSARLHLADGTASVVSGSARVPIRITPWPPALDGAPSALDDLSGRLELRVEALPVPPPGASFDAPARLWPEVDGTARLFGSVGRPGGSVDAVVRVPGVERLDRHRVSLEATIGENRRVDAALVWRVEERAAIQARATLGADRHLEATARADAFALGDLNAILPGEIGISGAIGLDASARGPLSNPDISASGRGRGIGVALEQGSSATVDLEVRVEGKAREPRLSGTLQVVRGVIQIPDLPRDLHARDGSSILMTEAGLGRAHARADTTAVGGTHGVNFAANTRADVTITIPSTVQLRGRGLDVTLSGALDLSFDGVRPILTGELSADSGTFSFLGRTFQIETGRATFFGGDEIDPGLDLTLSATRAGVRAFLRITGSAREPKLTLTSEPSLPEADIMSHLLFGERSEALDGDQTTFLRAQALGVVQRYAFPRLERRVADELGLDLVEVNQGESGVGGGTSVVFGKYLSPRVLVKLQQGFDGVEESEANLEYWLSRGLKLETHSGRRRSGLEISWTREY